MVFVLPGSIADLRFWRLSSWRRTAADPAKELPLFLGLWLVVMLAFFSAAATKLPGYILPVVPAGSLLVALAWRPLSSTGRTLYAWMIRTGWLDAALFALLATALQRSGLPLLLAGLLAAVALALIRLLLRPGAAGWLWLPNLQGFLAILALVVPPLAPLPDRERQLPLRQLAIQARRLALKGEPFWVVGTKRYSILFYGGEQGVFLPGRSSLNDRLRDDPAGLGLKASSTSVRLIRDRAALEALELDERAVVRLNQSGPQQLLRVSHEALQS